MKKYLIILTIPLLFVMCKSKDEDKPAAGPAPSQNEEQQEMSGAQGADLNRDIYIKGSQADKKRAVFYKGSRSLIRKAHLGGSLNEYVFEGFQLKKGAQIDSVWLVNFDVPGLRNFFADKKDSIIRVSLDTATSSIDDLISAMEYRGCIFN